MTLADAFSLRTKELMKKHGLTPSELSRKSGIACSALYNILNGNISSPTISTLNKLSKAFNISMHEFTACELFLSENLDDTRSFK